MTDMLTRGKLFVVEVDGHGSVIARIPHSNVEIARVHVMNNSTEAHVTATRELVNDAFANLAAQGYPRAYDFSDAEEVKGEL